MSDARTARDTFKPITRTLTFNEWIAIVSGGVPAFVGVKRRNGRRTQLIVLAPADIAVVPSPTIELLDVWPREDPRLEKSRRDLRALEGGG